MSILEANQPPVLPFCEYCDQPVERIQVGYQPFSITCEMQCCGRTAGVRLTYDKVMELGGSQKWYGIVRAGGWQQTKTRKRGG